MAASGSTVAVEGLDELVKAFGKMDKSLKRDLQKELKLAATIVAKAAKIVAASKGLAAPGRSGRGTGREIRMIKPFVRGSSVGVRSGAVGKDGYSYPIRHEYAGRGSTGTGPRAYLEPALVETHDQVIARFDQLLEDISSEGGFGRG